MISRAINYHKLYILCLLSLSLIRVSQSEQNINENKENNDEKNDKKQLLINFEKNYLITLPLEISIKPSGSNRLIRKPSIFNKYWNDNVLFHHLEAIQMKKRQLDQNHHIIPLQTLVLNYYEKNIYQAKYDMEEFPSVQFNNKQIIEAIEVENTISSSSSSIITKVTTPSKVISPKKRKITKDNEEKSYNESKSSKNIKNKKSQSKNKENGNENDDENNNDEDDMDIINLNDDNNNDDNNNEVEIIDREEIQRQTKRLRRVDDDLIDISLDQV